MSFVRKQGNGEAKVGDMNVDNIPKLPPTTGEIRDDEKAARLVARSGATRKYDTLATSARERVENLRADLEELKTQLDPHSESAQVCVDTLQFIEKGMGSLLATIEKSETAVPRHIRELEQQRNQKLSPELNKAKEALQKKLCEVYIAAALEYGKTLKSDTINLPDAKTITLDSFVEFFNKEKSRLHGIRYLFGGRHPFIQLFFNKLETEQLSFVFNKFEMQNQNKLVVNSFELQSRVEKELKAEFERDRDTFLTSSHRELDNFRYLTRQLFARVKDLKNTLRQDALHQAKKTQVGNVKLFKEISQMITAIYQGDVLAQAVLESKSPELIHALGHKIKGLLQDCNDEKSQRVVKAVNEDDEKAREFNQGKLDQIEEISQLPLSDLADDEAKDFLPTAIQAKLMQRIENLADQKDLKEMQEQAKADKAQVVAYIKAKLAPTIDAYQTLDKIANSIQSRIKPYVDAEVKKNKEHKKAYWEKTSAEFTLIKQIRAAVGDALQYVGNLVEHIANPPLPKNKPVQKSKEAIRKELMDAFFDFSYKVPGQKPKKLKELLMDPKLNLYRDIKAELLKDLQLLEPVALVRK